MLWPPSGEHAGADEEGEYAAWNEASVCMLFPLCAIPDVRSGCDAFLQEFLILDQHGVQCLGIMDEYDSPL